MYLSRVLLSGRTQFWLGQTHNWFWERQRKQLFRKKKKSHESKRLRPLSKLELPPWFSASSQISGDLWLVISDSHKKGFLPFFWWLVIHLVIHLFCFSVSITNCESPEKKVGSHLILIISNRQSPKKFCSFFTFNSHLSIANFHI